LLTNQPVSGKASPASAILKSTGLVDEYLAYPLATRSVVRLLALRRELARRRFCTAFLLCEARGRIKSFRDFLFFRFCGIPEAIGSAFRARDLVCQPRPRGELYESESKRLLRRIGALEEVNLAEDRWWDLRLTPVERTEAGTLLARHGVERDFIAFSLGTKFEVNDWTLPNWRALVEKLSRACPHTALVGLGVAEEARKTQEFLDSSKGSTANLCGLVTPRLSAAVLERALVFIGHDSGPMHLAAAVGTKCVAIFSGRNPPGQWFPRGQGHQVLYRRTDCFACGLSECSRHKKKCILGITADEVAAAVQRVLAGGSAIRPTSLQPTPAVCSFEIA
jgi:ADP-heptose:LPS heptosyltransferase